MPGLQRAPLAGGRILAVGLVFSAAVFGASCGENREDDLVEITAAEWSAVDGVPRIVVGGEWPLGVSTPPQCRVLEDREREISGSFGSDARTVLDGNTFLKEFMLDTEQEGGLPQTDYYVRCSITIDPGSTLSDTEPVSGEAPPVPE